MTRAILLRCLSAAIALVLFLGTGEIALRVIYRDGGTRTLGGPNGQRFVHLRNEEGRRGPRVVGPRRPGVPRLMILGDSITWGSGVRDYRDTWPEVLAASFAQENRPYELASFANPGRNIDEHLEQVEAHLDNVRPDALVYQWYLNDIEVRTTRPPERRWWHETSWYGSARTWSYLFYFVDSRLNALLPASGKSYTDYVLHDMAPGSLGWTEFERHFHSLAVRVAASVPKRILLLYPRVPFREPNPDEPIHDRIRVLTGPHQLSIPPAGWKSSLAIVQRPDAVWGSEIHVDASNRGAVLTTREYVFPAGALHVRVRLSLRDSSDETRPADLELVNATTKEVVSKKTLQPAENAGWQNVDVELAVPPGPLSSYSLQLSATGARAFSVASIDVAQDYGFELLDLSHDLNSFNTHASLFDSHPNEAAHRVIAARLHDALVGPAESRVVR